MVNQTVKAKLHYVFDPLCGWCYAAAPLIHAAAQLDGLEVVLHPGGMMSGANRQPVTPVLRNYVLPHDQRIAELTGQAFGLAYRDGLLCDETVMLDSTPPTLAIFAAQVLEQKGLAMLSRIQTAHYVQGLRVSDTTVLLSLASEIGFDGVAFAQRMDEQAKMVDAHFANSRRLMQQHGLRGFPSVLLEREGCMNAIDVSKFLGRPEHFAHSLSDSIGLASADQAPAAMLCTSDACSI